MLEASGQMVGEKKVSAMLTQELTAVTQDLDPQLMVLLQIDQPLKNTLQSQCLIASPTSESLSKRAINLLSSFTSSAAVQFEL